MPILRFTREQKASVVKEVEITEEQAVAIRAVGPEPHRHMFDLMMRDQDLEDLVEGEATTVEFEDFDNLDFIKVEVIG